MTTPNAYDWSWAHMPADVAKRHGAKVIMAYLSWDTSKNMTSAEIRAHHKLGLGVVLGWESLQGRALLGADAGHADGTAALAQMKTHVANVGYAPKVPVAIPFAVDVDVNASQFPAILAYVEAAQRVFDADRKTIHLVASAYGEYDLIEYLAAHGVSKGLFQTYAWSGGQVSKHTALYQFLNGQTLEGFSVDEDRVLNVHALGAWWPPNHPLNHPRPRKPKPSPKPAPKPIKRAKRRLYEVKEGDTLGRIADRFGLKLDELYGLNRFRHPFLRRHEYDLHIGWKIRVR
jgi:hypothetical protein